MIDGGSSGASSVFSGVSGQTNSTGMVGNFLVGAGSYVAADYVASMYK